MFTDTPDAVLVRRTFAAFNDGDFDLLSQVLAEDIAWEATGAHPLAGSYMGREEVYGFLGRAVELTEGTLRPQPLDIAGVDGRVLVRLQTTGRRPDGRQVDVEEFMIVAVVGGQVRQVRSLVPEQTTWDAFWA